MNQAFSKTNEKKEFEERVIQIDRVTRVVAGGRRMRFRAAVVIGNRQGKIGIGVDKSNDVVGAVQKAITAAKKTMIEVPLVNETIPHQIIAKYGGARVLLKPANRGTGIIAGGAVRAIAELSGIENIISKILGSPNKINNLKATMAALSQLNRHLASRSANANKLPVSDSIKGEKDQKIVLGGGKS